jgi:hypothetical protein
MMGDKIVTQDITQERARELGWIAYEDQGCFLKVEGGELLQAPMNLDGTLSWEPTEIKEVEICRVEFYNIGEEDALHCLDRYEELSGQPYPGKQAVLDYYGQDSTLPAA